MPFPRGAIFCNRTEAGCRSNVRFSIPKGAPGGVPEPMPQDGRPAAIWGVSQYAMLLLGSAPTLAGRVSRLFDGSPAKIGRSINGVVVEPSERLNSLSRDALLFIPRSKFLNQMLGQLHRIGFTGVARVVERLKGYPMIETLVAAAARALSCTVPTRTGSVH